MKEKIKEKDELHEDEPANDRDKNTIEVKKLLSDQEILKIVNKTKQDEHYQYKPILRRNQAIMKALKLKDKQYEKKIKELENEIEHLRQLYGEAKIEQDVIEEYYCEKLKQQRKDIENRIEELDIEREKINADEGLTKEEKSMARIVNSYQKEELQNLLKDD